MPQRGPPLGCRPLVRRHHLVARAPLLRGVAPLGGVAPLRGRTTSVDSVCSAERGHCLGVGPLPCAGLLSAMGPLWGKHTMGPLWGKHSMGPLWGKQAHCPAGLIPGTQPPPAFGYPVSTRSNVAHHDTGMFHALFSDGQFV